MQTWASNSLLAATSSSVTGAHQEQAVQLITRPFGVVFLSISRFIA